VKVKWGRLERYLKRHGYEIASRGGDKIIKAPKDGKLNRRRQQLYIGHKSCGHAGTEFLKAYVSKLKNIFGITEDDVNKE
jgi:hypothetical protein